MKGRWALTLGLALAVSGLADGAASAKPLTTSSGEVELLISRQASAGPTSFRLDLTVTPDDRPAFFGAMAARLSFGGQPMAVAPLTMTSLNEDREPTVYAGGVTVSTCTVGVCETGATLGAVMTVAANDSEAPELPSVVVVARASHLDWTFVGKGYTLRRLPPRFRYTSRRSDTVAGVDYLGTGVEAGQTGVEATGARSGSLAMAAAPCATTTSGVASRGIGRVTLASPTFKSTETCPAEDGRLAGMTLRGATWTFSGVVGGDHEFRGAQLLVIDAPLR